MQTNRKARPIQAKRAPAKHLPRSSSSSATPARRGSGGRLSRADWIETGQDILRDTGITGLKLAELTRRLKVSTGSFYHHFTDFQNYLSAVAEHFSVDMIKGLLARVPQLDPVSRIKMLARISVESRTFELDRAMRVWASMDQRAAATVVRSERLVLEFLCQAFLDLGFSSSEAELRSRILLSVNIDPMIASNAKSRRDFFKQAFDILAAPPG